MSKSFFVKRRKARQFALQALYTWQISQSDILDVEMDYRMHNDPEKYDVEYFSELVSNIPKNFELLCDLFSKYLDRNVEDVDPIEKSLLLIGAYELKFRIDVPEKVAINEAIELSKLFGAVDSHKFVNNILDKVAKNIRT